MNIFALDLDPRKAAQAHCDKHVVKMILESAQILSTVWHMLPEGAHYAIPPEAYRPTHKHHPCVKWAASSGANYRWLWQLASCLGEEFAFRYGHRHKSMDVINALSEPPLCVSKGPQTPFALAMPDEFSADYYALTGQGMDKGQAAVECYREYYRCAKAHMLSYRKRLPPDWLGFETNHNLIQHI